MNDDRRTLLQALGLTALGGLAGCQETTSQTDTDSTPTESTTPTATDSPTTTPAGTEQDPPTTTQAETEQTTTPQPDVTVQTTVRHNESGPVVEVRGEATTGSPIVVLEISVGELTITKTIDEVYSISFKKQFEIQGGQSYDVTVRVETNKNELTTRKTTSYIPTATEGLETDRLVGAHYYPWYEMHGGHENWTDTCVANPVLGEYASDDQSVIDQHLTWCLNHGINWLSVSWWGEGSGSDVALSDGLLEAEKFDQLSFSILYETTRLEQYGCDLDAEVTRNHLIADFQYLEEKFFSEDNYLRFDGRPVVFFWISQVLEGDAQAAFDEITAALDTDPYILVGLPFGQSLGTAPMSAVADGVTSYNPYVPRADIEEVFHESYARGLRTMNLSARATDIDFLPVVIPGFNDTAIPDSQREDNPVLSASPERYERVCKQIQPHLADSKAVLVTSFNEWYENTQIEPNEQYGKAYLKTTAQRLATGGSSGYDPTGKVFRLVFNETVAPTELNPDSSDDRQLAFMADQLKIYAGSERLAEFDIGVVEEEPVFLSGAFGIGSNDGENWRWLGGHTGEASLFIPRELEGANRAVLRGQPMSSNQISAAVYFGGEQTDQIDFGERDMQPFELEL
jgi:hypothetical protein